MPRRSRPIVSLLAALAALAGVGHAQTPGAARVVADRDHVTVIELTGNYDKQPPAGEAQERAIRQAVAQEFLRTHRDDYDFLVTFTGFPYNLGSDSEGTTTRGRYYAIRNDVAGIGQEIFDASAAWGSAGRLQGYIDMGALASLATDPTDPEFERTLAILAHEFAHRWGANLRFRAADGTISEALTTPGAAHWSFFLQSHNSVLGGNDWRDNGNGTFTSVGRSRSFYSPLDLYAMGLLPPSQVPPFFLIQAEGDPARLPEIGATVTGVRRAVTIDDVIAAEGNRVPAVESAPKRFKMAFLFLVRPGQTANGAQLRAISTIRDAFATRLLILTGGQAVVQVFPETTPPPVPDPDRILPPLSGPRTAPVDPAQGLSWLLSRQAADGSFADSASTRVRDTVAAIELLGEHPGAFASRQRALAWLASLPESSNVDTVARRLAAIAPQYSAADDLYLRGAQHASGGWGLRAGDEPDAFDTALALRSLRDNVPAAATARLLQMQRADGSFPLHPEGPGSILATLAVLDLAGRLPSAPLAEALVRATAWLETRQNNDGGFGEAGSTTYETAAAILHLSRLPSTRADLRWAVEFVRRGQLLDGSWNESIYETAGAVRALRVGALPNVTLVAGSMSLTPADPVEGEAVVIRVELANTGGQDLTNVVVRFHDGDPTAGGLPIGEDVTIAALPAQARVPVSAVWDTTERPGARQIVAIVDPTAALDESNEADNRLIAAVTVQPPPEGPDLAVAAADVVLSPDRLQTVPQQQTVRARVANLGRTDAPQVLVALFAGDPGAGGARVAEALASVPARGAAEVTFPFTVATAGERRYFVVADPENAIVEADETNNAAARLLPVQSGVDLVAVTGSLVFSQNPASPGQDVTIGAEVGNSGTADAFGVRARIFIDAPGGAIEVATVTLDVPAGATRPVTAIWRASRALSETPVVVQVDPANAVAELSETNNQTSAALTVVSSTDANLRVSHTELTVSAPVLQGGSATITIPVHNTGFAVAQNVGVAFYDGVPGSGGVQIGAVQTLVSLPPGGRAEASVVWSAIGGFGSRLIYVRVDPAGTVVEFDEQDNSAFVTVDVLSLPDLTISPAAISFTPPFPRAGDPVVISALVGNGGEQAALNATVRFYRGDPAAGGVQIGGDQAISVPAQGQTVVQMPFDLVTEAGATAIYVRVDATNSVAELDETNNVAARTLGVQDSSVFFSHLYFSPNGDGVQDATEFFFRLTGAEATAIRALDRGGETVRAFALGVPAASDSVQWDGRDAQGRIVPDGEYRFVAVAAGGAALASATVVVDTNNAPVGDAIGTKYLLDQNLTCDARGVQSAAQFANVDPDFKVHSWLADDTGLVSWVPTQMRCPGGFFYYRCNFQYVSSPQVGVYITSPDGQRLRITPDSWTGNAYAANGTEIAGIVPSADGRRILIALRRTRTVNDVPGGNPLLQYFGPLELWTVNTDGSGLAQIGTLPRQLLSTPQDVPLIVWSPDGRFLSVLDFNDAVNGERRLYVMQADGSQQTVIRATPWTVGGGPSEAIWSPDSRRLLYLFQAPTAEMLAYAVNPDGTDQVEVPQLPDMPLWLGNVMWLGNDRLVSLMWDSEVNVEHLWQFSLAGNPPQRISANVTGVRQALPAPDGRSIVFADLRPTYWPSPPPRRVTTGVWRIDLEGRVEEIYAAAVENQGIDGLAWTRDGRRLAFVEEVVTRYEACPDGDGGMTAFCGESYQALAALDLGERTVRVIDADAADMSLIGFFPDGNSFLLIEQDGPRVVALGLDDGVRRVLFEEDVDLSEGGGFTPSGKYFLYRSHRESLTQAAPCFKNFRPDVWVLRSLLNLSTDLSFQRDRSQLLVRGTAEDRHFASVVLEAAPASDPTAWTPIAPPGDVPVINGLLAAWIPPSEGTFLVRLTATDLAGNRAVTRKRVTWGLTPSITNLTVSPRAFSPNGDGARDTTTINYVVLGPVNLVFTISDAANAVVRTITQANPVIGPASIAWDGRTDAGQTVADGVYSIRVLDYEFFVTVDSTPPDVRLSLGSAFRTVPTKTACVPTSSGPRCTTFPGPVVDTPLHRLTGRAHDADLAAWTLEAGVGANPSEWVALDQGTGLLVALDVRNRPVTPVADRDIRTLPNLLDVVNRRYRLTAVDQAGNRAVAVSDLAPQEIVLHAWDDVPVPTTRTLEQSLGPHRLAVMQTLRTAQQLTLQYRLQGSAGWLNGPAVPQPAAAFDLAWDNSVLAGGRTYDVRLVAQDAAGSEFVSNGVTIHSDIFELTRAETTLVPRMTTTYGVVSLREPMASVRLVLAIAGDPEVGATAAVFSDPVTFSIVVAPDPAITTCAGEPIAVRFRGVGESGRVYYSNTRTVTRFGTPDRPCTSPGRGALLELSATRVGAADCALPNPERVQIRLTGLGIQPDTLRLTMQDVPNGPQRELAGVSLPFSREIDTTGRPEGIYHLQATALGTAEAGSGPVTAAASFIVDRTPPVAQLTYPAANTSLCPTRVGGATVVVIEGVANDANFERYAVEYGFGETPGTWLPIFPNGPAEEVASRSPRQGALANWNVGALPGGTYTIRLKVFDRGGNVQCRTVTFTLQGGLALTDVRAGSPLISPNGDGTLDGTDVSFTLDAPALVGAQVFAAPGGQRASTPVRTLIANAQFLAGANTILWDGLGDLGAAVPDGLYHVVITARDACGNPVTAFTAVEVDATRPEAAIGSPAGGETSRILVDVRGRAADLHFAEYRLEIGAGTAPVDWTLLRAGRAPVVDGLLGTWNTRGEPGAYTMRLTVSDTAGNRNEALLALTVMAFDPLVQSLRVTPPIFSPNGDGTLDAATVEFSTSAAASIVIEARSGDTVVALVAQTDLPAGTHTATWNGFTAAGVRADDGEYALRLVATAANDPGRVQTETIPVIVDATAPVIAIAAPAENALVSGDVVVTGSVIDPNLDTYAASYGAAAAGPTVPLDEGRQSRTNHTFGTLRELSDGSYVLRITAADLAGNAATLDRPFGLDGVSPTVSITAPAAGVVAGGATSVLAVTGAVTETNLRDWTLRFGAGLDPAAWTTLATQTTLPATASLGSWDTTGLPDGTYTLSLRAVDRAGTAAEARVQIVVDQTPPVAAIRQPANGARLSTGVEIRGDATDANFASATVDLSEGPAGSAAQFVTLATLTAPVADGLFVALPLPVDGTYTLRLTVTDAAGHRTERLTTVVFDTEPLPAPANLTATLELRTRARLAWSAVAGDDVAGYNVYRAGRRLNTTPIAATAFVDENLTDGTHRYTVAVIDAGGLESARSNEASVTVDLTAPTARIQSPASGTVVADLVDLRGTAASVDDFREYRVLVGSGPAPASFNLIRRSPAPVSGALLAQWDAAGLPDGAVMTLRLEAEDLDGNVASDQITVTVDNTVPAAPVLLSVTQNGANLVVAWQPSLETDVVGYLLYQGHLLANARRLVSGSLAPYVIRETSYVDQGLADGRYEYYVVAIDRAGNISAPSNSIAAVLDARAPRMTIVEPATGTITDRPVTLVATSPDGDVASVQFQIRSGNNQIWSNLGGPIASAPYALAWDPRTVALGVWVFRAIGTDVSGNTDVVPNTIPPMIAINYRDITPPAPPTGVAATVTAGTVALSWTASPDSDVTRYDIYRQTGSTAVYVTSTVGTTTFTDLDVSDGAHAYFVRAIDAGANQSVDSNLAPARVYTPSLTAPAACLAVPLVELRGTGATPGATVTLYAVSAFATTQAAADGTFVFSAVPLAAGVNSFSVDAADASGNTSRRSAAVTVTFAELPGPVAALSAIVTGNDVALSWTPAAAAASYAVYRNGLNIGPPVDVTSRARASASSEHVNGHVASRAIDGNPATFWLAQWDADDAPWWQADFGLPVSLREVRVQWLPGLYAQDFTIAQWTGESWEELATITDNQLIENVIAVEPSAPTTRLRITIIRSLDAASFLTEVRMLAGGNVTETTFTDLGVPRGRYTYAVGAASSCGLEGTRAETQVDVGDVTAPAAPRNLTAAVEGSNVRLQWTPGTEPDLIGTHVYQELTGGEWERLTAAPVPTAQYLDADRLNGTYRYRVTAVDGSGNESAPSNVAEAVVALETPTVPALTVSAPAAGRMLDVAWTAVQAPGVAYLLRRSTVAGGPYDDVFSDPIPVTTYRDADLNNGITYFYVVSVVDELGNVGPPSPEASGTPADLVPPPPPVLLHPTDAARPVVVNRELTRVAGMAEPGAEVTLLRRGLALGSVMASRTGTLEAVGEPGDRESRYAFHAGTGRLAAFVEREGASQAVLAVTDTVARSTRFYEDAIDGFSPSFTQDGRLLAYGSERGGYSLRILDVDSGAFVRTIPIPGSFYDVQLAPNGERAVILRDDPSTAFDQLWLLEIATGELRVFTDAPSWVNSPLWSPDSRYVIYSADAQLYIQEVTATQAVEIDNRFPDDPAFSPDSTRLAYEFDDAGTNRIAIYDIAANATAPLPGPADTEVLQRSRPVFSPDGRSLAYYEEGENVERLATRNLDGQNIVVLADDVDSGDRLFWSSAGALVMADDAITLVHPPGVFTFESVRLEADANVFSAIAEDEAGQASPPSAAITVIRDISGLPDLVVADSDFIVYPLFAAPGARVRLSAVVRNTGATAASGVTLTFADEDAQGTVTPIGEIRDLGTIAAGGQATVTADWTAGGDGAHRLRARVDPLGAVAESSETNNSVAREVVVAAVPVPLVRIATDRGAYGSDDTVVVLASASNPGGAAAFVVTVAIEDALGNQAAALLNQTLTLPYGTREIRAEWSTAGALAGEYRARATLRRADGYTTTAATAFSVAAQELVTATLVSDRTTYTVGEVANLIGTVRNGSANVDVANVTAVTVIRAADGALVHQSETALGTILLGTQGEARASWATAAPGAYTATLTARQGTRVLVEATRSFSVAGVARLAGTLTVPRPSVPAGDALELEARVENSGTQSLGSARLRLLVVDAETRQAVRTSERTVDLAAGEAVIWPLSIATGGLAIKTYALSLTAEMPEPVTLAAGAFTVLDVTAPVLALTSPAAGTVTRADTVVSVRALDDASAVARVEISLNEGPWQAMAIADASSGRYTRTVAASAANEGVQRVAIRAFDSAGNGDATSTSDPNPVTMSFTIDITSPAITVTGVADGGEYDAAVVPVFDVRDANLLSSTATLDGAPFVSGTPVEAAGQHLLVVSASDRAGNSASQSLRFTIAVAGNRPPTAADAAVTTAEDTAVAVALGATDPDGDALTFTVTTPENGELSGTPPALTYTPAADFNGADSFTFTVSDGIATSAPATVTITVTPVNDAPVANAGAAQTVDEGALVRLDGSASNDPDGDALSYTWTQTDGPAVTLDRTDPARPTFTAPEVGRAGETIAFDLVVGDGTTNSAAARVSVAVRNVNAPPTVGDRTVVTDEDTPIAIAVAVADPDDDLLTIVVSAPTRGTVTGTVPDLVYTPNADVYGTDSFTVTASDPDGLTATGTITVTVAPVNDPPIAVTGPDQSVAEGTLVTLDGTASYDVDTDPLTWQWTQVSGPAVSLTGGDSPRPTFEAPEAPRGGVTLTFRLAVSDGQVASEPALANVTVTNVNNPPVADAGVDQRVGAETPVTLDGSASYDPDSDPLTFAWRQTAGPAVELVGADSARPTFTAPLVSASSVLAFELTVSDGLAAAVDQVQVRVDPVNRPPIARAGPDQTVEERAHVHLDGSGSSDPDSDPLTYRWRQVAGPQAALSDETSPRPFFVAPAVAPAGDTLRFELVVSDGVNDSAPDYVDVHVRPAAGGPSCSLAEASPSELWPPNHGMVLVRIAGLEHEHCDHPHGHEDDDDDGHGDDDENGRLTIRVTKVTQDEPVAGTGHGDTAPDAVIDGAHVFLRAERDGKGNGRVYRIHFVATDAAGRSCSGAVTVQVPHDRRRPAVDDGQTYDSTKKPGKKKK